MMIESAALYRAAGISAVVALVALVVSAIAIALFFAGAGQVFGPINDVFVAVTLIALVLPILAVDRVAGAQAGLWLRIVTVAAITGAVLAAVGQLMLVAGVIDLQTSFVTGGLGIVPVLIWIVALVVLAVPVGVLPVWIGWLAAAAIALIVVGSVIAMATTGPVAWVTWAAVVVVLVAWLGSLAATFMSRTTA
ncbi:MAG TPA: hypothetical protein VEO91_05890 [Candidatus Limnocylindria bacterium]|nr:hypothetical protein [Candidatus Limnocylindria bacterium]